jgi:hypothetical protein
MSIIVTLLLVASEPVAVIPPAFHGTWVVTNATCTDAGKNDGVIITAGKMEGSDIATTPTKVRLLGASKMMITGTVTEQGADSGSAGYVMSLRNKGQGLVSVMVSDNGKAVSKPRAIRYKKCS